MPMPKKNSVLLTVGAMLTAVGILLLTFWFIETYHFSVFFFYFEDPLFVVGFVATIGGIGMSVYSLANRD